MCVSVACCERTSFDTSSTRTIRGSPLALPGSALAWQEPRSRAGTAGRLALHGGFDRREYGVARELHHQSFAVRGEWRMERLQRRHLCEPCTPLLSGVCGSHFAAAGSCGQGTFEDLAALRPSGRLSILLEASPRTDLECRRAPRRQWCTARFFPWIYAVG